MTCEIPPNSRCVLDSARACYMYKAEPEKKRAAERESYPHSQKRNGPLNAKGTCIKQTEPENKKKRFAERESYRSEPEKTGPLNAKMSSRARNETVR